LASKPGLSSLKKKPESGSDCWYHLPENPVKRPDLIGILKSPILGYFMKIRPHNPPIFTSKIWVSFHFWQTVH
jgi:hypothetical protein